MDKIIQLTFVVTEVVEDNEKSITLLKLEEESFTKLALSLDYDRKFDWVERASTTRFSPGGKNRKPKIDYNILTVHRKPSKPRLFIDLKYAFAIVPKVTCPIIFALDPIHNIVCLQSTIQDYINYMVKTSDINLISLALADIIHTQPTMILDVHIILLYLTALSDDVDKTLQIMDLGQSSTYAIELAYIGRCIPKKLEDELDDDPEEEYTLKCINTYLNSSCHNIKTND